jgi:hypothetical protein
VLVARSTIFGRNSSEVSATTMNVEPDTMTIMSAHLIRVQEEVNELAMACSMESSSSHVNIFVIISFDRHEKVIKLVLELFH